ncbi:pyridoxamine 5'-phosphate oxidase family protein [Hyalangium minutum]|uniref:Phosphohydrolase n=1 Tax=Hyalangium minutum TaxID=394096 RepID=A0A085WHN9_9BACT|nr:pyridoxamine 5'-phosphate oxidase family protein [Hyalangium minutum]KFE67202.1 Phosphohydrolase [Hyalangium minutum]
MVTTVSQLEACVGAPALPVKMKQIDHLDPLARAWVAASPLAAVVVAGARGISVTLAGGEPGFIKTEERALSLKRELLDGPFEASPGDGVALLSLVPGTTETLRINGRVTASDTELRIAVEECFVHCGKAMIRSSFWAPEASAAGEALATARFCVLATVDAAGHADASPKGDPRGFLLQIDERTVALPDRPGNKRADGHRNVLDSGKAALLALTPGQPKVVRIQGAARLTAEEALLSRMAVDNKKPIIATLLDIQERAEFASEALVRARPWAPERVPAPGKCPTPAELLAAHVKLNKTQGLAATAVRLAVRPSLVNQGLAHDYRINLY